MGVCHHTKFMCCWFSDPGLHACEAGTLPAGYKTSSLMVWKNGELNTLLTRMTSQCRLTLYISACPELYSITRYKPQLGTHWEGSDDQTNCVHPCCDVLSWHQGLTASKQKKNVKVLKHLYDWPRILLWKQMIKKIHNWSTPNNNGHFTEKKI